MKILGNILWLVFGGFFIAIEYIMSSLVLFATIIGIPFAIQTFKLASLAIWPFGKEVRHKPNAGGCLLTIMNVIWLFIGGIWICLSHLVFGLLWTVTIIGIPFARQHFKLAVLALTPFGKEVV